jgi:eukaryotic-like serine/threonine-protein kinase
LVADSAKWGGISRSTNQGADMADWNPRVNELFLKAVQLSDLVARNALLALECGDEVDVRRAVETLLNAHDQAGGFLNDPHAPAIDPLGTTADLPRRDEPIGALLAGRYKLIEAIGEGGMGSVYMAQQTAPIKRAVAVKVIKPGMDSKAVLARFEAERQALAMMDHPNIARVLDAGSTESGRPFFVMELVKGVPITQYCDDKKLTPRQRLELFVPVCGAIQHAHQKGIVHRDIKPNNVIVAMYDDKPVPKVIDFGVAKATGQSLTDKTLMTGFGALVGTPEYMSPEQANLNNLDIDTRSDVYSLGVLLYELLTGSTPVDRKSLYKAALLEVLRIVREVEAPRPSAKLSTIDTLANVAANRGTEPAKLSKLMKGELDWVVLKALEKDRTRRYETANGLARDIQRYLADEIVEARPPSAGYRLRKFARRHKGRVLAAGLVLFALLAGIVGTTLGLIEARRQERVAVAEFEATERARKDEAEQRGIAEAAATAEHEAKLREQQRADGEAQERKRADAEKERALRFLDRALDTLRATTGEDVEKLIGAKTELSANEREYLEAIAHRWEAFAKKSEGDAESRIFRGEGHFHVATLWHRLGRTKEAIAEYRAARDVRRALVAQYPNELDHQRELSTTHLNLGILLAETGHRDEGQVEIQAALDLLKGLVDQSPKSPEYQNSLSVVRFNYGAILEVRGETVKAQVELEASRELQRDLVERFPEKIDYQQELAHTLKTLGGHFAELRKRDEALVQYRAAAKLQKALVARFPKTPGYQEALANTHNGIGVLFAEDGKFEQARPEYLAARDLLKKLADDYPAVPSHQVDLGGSYCNYGNLYRQEGKPADSLEWLDLAAQTLERAHQKMPLDSRGKEYLRNCYIGRAQSYDALKKYADAAKEWERAIELLPPPHRPPFRGNRAVSLFQAGQYASAMEEVNELTKSEKWLGHQWYNFASMYSVASSKLADKKQEYADRAMELLRKSVKSGYKDLAHMKTDANLDHVRKRPDFESLLAELEGKGPLAK